MAKNYVNNQSLRLELIASINNDKLTPKCVEMFILMVDRIQSSFKYIDIQDKEDCRSSALEVVLTKWRVYDVTRDNPFAYFTRMIYNGLYAGWNEIDKKRGDYSISQVFIESV